MYLVSRDSKGKLRIAHIELNKEQDFYVISRETGQFNGKMTKQPDIVITEGKAKRTLEQQAELQINAKIKEYLDKGYKIVDEDIQECDEEQLNNLVGDNKTDTNGFAKHMLAKQSDKVSDKTINKLEYWYVSRKIDGVRCSFYWRDDEIHTASRGGGDYDIATSYLRTNPKFIEFFKSHPDIILDGELYKHGKSLQQISGAARREDGGTPWLEYYIYDVMLERPFEERRTILEGIKEYLGLSFCPQREWDSGDLRVQMVPHEKVSGKDAILKLHDEYVAEGWEGAVARDPWASYKFGGRGSEMVKFKMYQDAEFTITGISEGLRDEDMCFTMVTDEGLEFSAKPMGSRDLKEQYRRDLEQLIGKRATVKFFYLSDTGVPLQPVLKAIRDYE